MASSQGCKFQFPHNIDLSDLDSEDNQVVVVGMFGKSSITERGCKAAPFDSLLTRCMFQKPIVDAPMLDDETLTYLEGYYDAEHNVIYLHLMGCMDAYCLTQAFSQLQHDMEEKGFLPVWAEMKCNYAKVVLFLFFVCHIIVISHPRLCFDVSLIQFFRTLDAARQKVHASVSEILKTVNGVPKDWVVFARFCTPRVLFLFYSDSPFLEKESDNKGEKLPPVKRLEHALEDQIYRILKKSRIISKNSSNSLFAIPANQEYVFVETSLQECNTMTDLLSDLISLCSGGSKREEVPLAAQGFPPIHTLPSDVILLDCDRREEHSFRSFLCQHIEVAITKGFDDNVRRHTGPFFFEVPTAECWFEVSNKLYEFFTSDGTGAVDLRSKQAFTVLHSLVDVDMKFSEARCAKVLPLATAAYQENLPSHYTQEYHQSRLEHAIDVFLAHARGPAADKYVVILQQECENQWRNHRQMCETLSLTGNHCINPQHVTDSSDNAAGGRQLPVMPHGSGVKYIHACNCGRKQGSREDPFSVRAANYGFYKILSDSCCHLLQSIIFPTDDTEKELKNHLDLSNDEDEDEDAELEKLTPPQISRFRKLCLEESGSEAGSNPQTPRSESQPDAGAEFLDQYSSDELMMPEPILTRARSTSPKKIEPEYPMLHDECPEDYLPTFPSWSLVCLGPSSLYSHSHGIHDQPGFLQGSNFLLPWDVSVRVDSKEKWPAIAESMGKKGQFLKAKKGKADLSEFNVKIFLGIEYECKRGHRFMMAAPDRVLKATGTGLVRDTATKVATADMPLYYNCPCRPGKPWLAQLMRVHVVTPKAPVHVTVFPSVVPAPAPCPTFSPGVDEPIRLSQSTYWILRLPYIYGTKGMSYPPPKDENIIAHGHLKNGLLGITEVTLE